MRKIAGVLILALLAPTAVAAQAATIADAWREVATRVGAGNEVRVQLADGSKHRVMLVRVDETGLLLLPRTRVPVPVQHVPYDAIVSLEPEKGRGAAVAKAVAIGIGAGVGAFVGLLWVAVAIAGD